jgi:hypothetical protein
VREGGKVGRWEVGKHWRTGPRIVLGGLFWLLVIRRNCCCWLKLEMVQGLFRSPFLTPPNPYFDPSSRAT